MQSLMQNLPCAPAKTALCLLPGSAILNMPALTFPPLMLALCSLKQPVTISKAEGAYSNS